MEQSSFASWGLEYLISYHCGLPQLKVRAGCLEVSSQVASRSHVRVASRSQGTNFEIKIFNSRCFLALLTETSFTTTHYYPIYEVWAIENFLW